MYQLTKDVVALGLQLRLELVGCDGDKADLHYNSFAVRCRHSTFGNNLLNNICT